MICIVIIVLVIQWGNNLGWNNLTEINRSTSITLNRPQYTNPNEKRAVKIVSPVNKDEYFIADLIGMKVENEDGSFSGVLKDVIETGANDVYTILCGDGKEVLIPAIKECILSVDLEKSAMKVHLLDGL